MTQSLHPADPGTRHTPSLLIAAHAAVWLIVLILDPPQALADDIVRFRQIVIEPGIPYRDFPVEYMPLQTLLIRSLLSGSTGVVAVRVVTVSVLSDLAVYLLSTTLFGRRAGIAYLWFALPLQVFMLYRLDLVAVVMVLCALWLARRGLRSMAGAMFAAAVLFKLWPLVLLPLALRRGGTRGLVTGGIVVCAGLGAWVGIGGTDSVRYVISFREATGWQIESTVGAALNLFTADAVRPELGAQRIGAMGTWAPQLLRAAGLLLIVAVWWKAHRSRWEPAGLPAAAAVAVLIATSPAASTQYISWLLPWAAIAVAERRRIAVSLAMGGAASLAGFAFLVYWDLIGDRTTVAVISAVRALLLWVIPLAWFIERDGTSSSRAGEPRYIRSRSRDRGAS